MMSQRSVPAEREVVELNEIELDVLSMVANGYASSRIADMRRLAIEEVDYALKSAQFKLSASNRLQAVSIALLKGYIGMERI
jgi:DNA-binding CsgD family transcriptional regulator